MKTGKKGYLLIGIAFGSVIGAAAALLLTPMNGREVRALIADKTIGNKPSKTNGKANQSKTPINVQSLLEESNSGQRRFVREVHPEEHPSGVLIH